MEKEITIIFIMLLLYTTLYSHVALGFEPFNQQTLYGRIVFVDEFPDFKVKIVDEFPQLEVKIVDEFPNGPGEWEIVDEFPDFKIKIVRSGEDLTVKFLNEKD